MTSKRIRMIDDVYLAASPVLPDPGHAYRLITFNNGLLLMAWIMEISEGVMRCIFPMELVTIHEPMEDSIVEYEFVPYLENLVDFDIDTATVITYPISSIESITCPTNHVVRNYVIQLKMYRLLTDEMNGVETQETMH
jgi:hypothetical protein